MNAQGWPGALISAAVFIGSLLIPYALLTFFHVGDRLRRGRWSIALFFGITGTLHFWATKPMSALVPPTFPWPVAVIYASGFLEWAGAIGVLFQRTSRWTGIALIVFLVAIFPANVYGMLRHVPVAGHDLGLVYLVIRVPLQLWLMSWVWYYAVRN